MADMRALCLQLAVKSKECHMDAEALKKGMLDALKAGRLTNAVEQVAKLDVGKV